MIDITYYGHNCFLISSDVKILMDPFITDNPKASAIDINAIQADYILVTHGHGDHIANALHIAENNKATIVTMVEVASWFNAQGYQKTQSLNFGGTFKMSTNCQAKYVQAVHSSGLPDGSYGGHPGSFILTIGGKKLFLAGDTALHSDLRMYGDLNDFSLAILPIGGTFTMDYHDAAIAASFLKCDEVIGCHYDTFPPIEIDHEKALESFSKAAKKLHLLEIGETFQH